jgi:hypothetical protein
MAATVPKTAKISWRPFCGNFALELHGEIFLKICALGKRLTIALIAGPSKVYGTSFF